MRIKLITIASCLLLVVCSAFDTLAQDATTSAVQNPTEQSVALSEQTTAYDARGRVALTGRLRTSALNGSPDAPVKNVQFVITNSSPFFYTYVSGWVTFYDAGNVRCGEGLFKLDALAPNESVEVDAPGIRIRCAASRWRIVATNLLTRTVDTAKPADQLTQPPANETNTVVTTPANAAATVPPLEIEIDGETHPIQLGNPLELNLRSRRVRIIVRPAP